MSTTNLMDAGSAIIPGWSGLSPDERMIVVLKSLVGTATGKGVFFEVVRASGIRPPGGKSWSPPILNVILDALEKKKLLTAETLTLRPELVEPMAARASRIPDGRDLIRKVLAAVPRSRWEQERSYAWGYSTPLGNDLDFARRLRLAALANDAAEMERLCAIAEAEARTGASPDVMPGWLGPLSCDPTWLATLDEGIRDRVAAAQIAAIMDFGWIDAETAGLAEFVRQQNWGEELPRLDRALLRLDVLDERFAEARGRIARLPASDAWEGVSAEASIAFLSGDTGKALDLFRGALRDYRKLRGKRNVVLPGEAGVFHLLALLQTGDATRHGEITTALKAAGRADSVHCKAAYGAIEVLLRLVAGETARLHDAMHRLGLLQRANPLGLAVITLALALVDTAQASGREDGDKRLFDRIVGLLPAIARPVAEIHVRLSGGSRRWADRLDGLGNGSGLSFLDIVVVKPEWERAFDKLSAFLTGEQKKAASGTGERPDKRLAFLLDPTTCQVTTLEQVAKGDRWSPGRQVSLKRLREQDPTLRYLTPEDRHVLKTIRRRDDFYYSGAAYEFDAHRTPVALIGHPHVFDAKHPDRRVELVSYPVELVVTERKGGIRIALSHSAARPMAHIEQETPTRWRVIEISPRLVDLASTLGGGLLVPEQARDRVVALVRTEASPLPVRSDLADAGTEAVAGDAMAVVQIRPSGEGLHLNAVVRPLGAKGPAYSPGEGGQAPLVEVAGGFVRVGRDLAAERKHLEAFIAACPAAAPWRIGDHAWQIDDLEAALEVLQEIAAIPDGVRVEWPEGESLKPTRPVDMSALSFTVTSERDWFEVSGTIAVDEDLVVDMTEILERLDQARGRFVPLDGGRFLALTAELKRRLEQFAGVTEAARDGRRLSAAGALAAADLVEDAGRLEVSKGWRDLVAAAREAGSYSPEIPAGLQAELRDYQHDGFVWMMRLARLGLGACLADDMGLGKTVQAIAVLLARAGQGPALVVAPTSVCHNWETEIARFAPALGIVRLSDAADRAGTIGTLGPGDVLIVSYGLLTMEVEALAARPWCTVVFDEAQNLKNADALRSQASRRVVAGFRVALSGTPVENRLDELWSLLDTVVPGLLGSRESFQRRFAGPIERDRTPQARAALRTLVRPYLLRRTKAAVLAELPSRTEMTIAAPPGPEECAFHEALRRKALAALEEPDASAGQRRIRILAEITRLRRAACHPSLIDPGCGIAGAKLSTFLELVDELRENRHRALVFSQFVSHLEVVKAALQERGVPFLSLDGSTPAPDRARRVAAFQAGEGDLFLISLRAGGTGLNLTAADYVIHLDPWWNPAVEDQATDRAHRIGQTRAVTVYRLITEGTIEERILDLHATKRDLAADLLDETAMSTRLSEEDLMALITQAHG